MARSRPRATRLVAAAACAPLLLGVSAGASAAAPPAGKASQASDTCGAGRGIPDSQISIQLFSLRSHISEVGIEAVLAELADIGYRLVEPYSFHGLTAQEFEALLDEHGLKTPTRHASTNEAGFDQHLADAKLLGQKFTGSGGFASPGIRSYEDVLATAETMDRLGQRSVRNGTGKLFGHNHNQEFETTYVDVQGDGTVKSAWQLLVENTDPRYVTFQLDTLWAYEGGADVVQLIEQYGDRIDLLHVKDGAGIDPAPGRQATITTVGEGDVDWQAVFAAAKGKVRVYSVENDRPTDAMEFARDSFAFMDCVTF